MQFLTKKIKNYIMKYIIQIKNFGHLHEDAMKLEYLEKSYNEKNLVKFV
jgi:hypothetical protein